MIEKIPNAINAGTASDPYKNATVRTIAKPDAQPVLQIPALPNVVKATHEQYQGIASSDTGFLRSASLKYQRLLGETQQTEQDVARLDYAIWMSDRAGVSVDHAFHHAEDVQKRLFDYADNISVYDGWKYFNEYMKKTNFEEKVLDKIDARFEGLYNSNLSSEEKEAGYEELRQEYLKAMGEFPSFKHAESWVPTSWLEGVASTVPYMTKIATAAAAGAAVMGLGAMALGSFGTLSPIALAATPMLAATAKFATFGAAAGGYAMSKQLIQNQHTISRLMWEDEQGNHLDPRVVYWSRHLSSALSAGTEMWAASAVLGGIGKLLFGNTLESVISTSLWKRAMQGGLLYAKGVGVESFEEGLQKVTEDVTDNLAKWVDSKLHGTNWDYVGFKDILKNAAGDFLQSVPTMMTLGLIPFAGSTAVSMATAKGDARADARVYFDTESGETVSAWNIHNPVSEYDKDAVGKRIDAAAKGRQKLAPIKVVPAGQSRDGMQQYRVVEGMDTYQALFERGVQNMQVEVKQRSDYTQQLGEENYAAFGDQVNTLASAVGGRVDIQGGRAYIITDDAQKAFLKRPESTLAFEDNTSIPGTSGRYSVDLELDVAGQSGKVIAGSEGTWAADRLVGSAVDSAINELEAQDVNTKAMRSVMSAIYRETRAMDAAQAADHITKASPRLMRQLDKLTPEQQELPSVQQLRTVLSSPFDASTLASTEAVASAEATKKPPYEMTPEEFAEAAQKEGGVEELIAERRLKAKQENAQQDWEKAADAPVSDKAERHAEAMQKVVDAIDAKVGTKTQVVALSSDLPAVVKTAAVELGLGPKDIKAAYHNGSVFIVAESSTADSIEATFAHEWVAHRGLRVLLGNEYKTALTTLYDRIGEKRIRSVIPASVQGKSKAYQVDEYLAIKAGQLQKGGTIESVEMGFLERAMDAVRRVLRKLGFKVRMTDLEVRRLLADANAALGESVTDVDGKTTETEEAPPVEETEDVQFEVAEDYQPKKTGKGFKLFDMVDGKLYPLFIGSKIPTPVGVWLKAENRPTKGFARRPGWHIGSTTPDAPWLKGDDGTDAGTYRSKRAGGTRVWAEVEYPMDVDYQPQADMAPTRDLPDTIPEDGYYLFKEGSRGTWVVSGALKVNRILSDQEVAGILEEQGYDPTAAFEPYRKAIIKRRDTIARKKIDDIRFEQDLSRAEYSEVYDRYYNTDQWMKAPNGKPTNLTEKQWVQVRTPAFIEWFGDWMNDPENASKVVDENGEPKVLYHGSRNVFDVFSKQRSSYGYFFTPDKETAVFYGDNLYAVYLRSSNPANLNDYKTRKAVLKYAFGDKYDPAALGGYLESRYYDHNEFGVLGDLWELDSAEEQDAVIDRVVGELEGAEDYDQIIEDVALFREGISETGVDANRSYGSQDFYLNYQDDVLRSAEDMGYDGVSMTDPSSTGRSESYVVYKPTQIKSATDNIGTFDGENPNIRFEQVYMAEDQDTRFETLSTRLPSAKGIGIYPLNELKVLGYDVLLSDLPTLEKNLKQMYKTVNMREPDSGMSPKEQVESIIDHIVNNLLFLHDHMDAAQRMRAKLWYVGARKTVEAWARRYGISEMQGAALIAVLSPQNGWFTNVTQAERIADMIFGMRDYRWDEAMTSEAEKLIAMTKKNAEKSIAKKILLLESDDEKVIRKATREIEKAKTDFIYYENTMRAAFGHTLGELLKTPDIAARYIRIYDQVHNDRSYRIISPEGGVLEYVTTDKGENATAAWKGFDTIAKGVSILMDGRTENVYYQIGQQHKVRNFYNNIFDPFSKDGFTTIDTHAVAAALLRPLSSSDVEVNQAFGNAGASSSSNTGLNGTYPIYLEAYKRAAEQRGLLPREMQSITWEAVRGLFETSQKSGLKKDADKIWKRYKAGEITQAQAQAEIIELSGDITAPSWAASEYTDTIQRTYSGPPQQAIDARGDIGRSKPKGKLALEVAPDPNNKELTAEWNSLAYNDKAEITSTIIEKIIPEALKELGVGGETISMIGGYEGATNPSIGLVLEREGLLLSAAKLLGYALSQDSMAIISDKEVLGTSPVDAVVITLPEGYGATEIEALYKRIYELKDNGSHLADGHTTANGFMTILNFSGMDIQEFTRLIYKHLNGEFETRWVGLFSALIEKEEYQDVPGTDKTRRAAGWAPVQGRSNRLRDEASFLLRQEISRRKNRVQGRSEEGSQGTEDLSTTRFELSESGAAAGLDGSETKPRPISEKYMQRHRTQVQAAMKRGLTVPDRVLEAYAGEEWADKELADRKLIRSFSWILPLAKDINSPEELKALVEEELGKQGFDVLQEKTPEDLEFYQKLLDLASPMTKSAYVDQFMDVVNSDRNLRSMIQDIAEARENWQGLGLPRFIWGLASKVENGSQLTDADLDMIRSYTVRNREKMATAYYGSRGDMAALSVMGSEEVLYGDEEPERRAVNAALIKDPEVLRQMLDGTITYGRLVEYEEQLQQEMTLLEGENDDLQAEIDALNREILERSAEKAQALKDQKAADREMLESALKEETQRRRAELSELRNAYKEKMASALKELRDKQKERDEVRMAREFVERVAARMRRPVPPQTTSYTVGRKMEALAEFVIPSKWYRMEKTEDGLHRAEPDSARATALIYYLSDPADDVETFLHDIQRFKDLTFGDFTTDQIALLYGITEHIRERGRREMAAFLEAQRMRRDVAVNKILAEVLGGEKAQVFENIGSIESDKEQKSGAVFNAQAMSLRPPRMILLMSGGKEGVMYDWYINKINEATDAEIRNYQRRMKAGQQKMKELGITVGMLEKELTYNDVTMRTDDVLHLWIGMKNEKNRNAILYGNRIELGVVSGLTSQLTENQKAWATYMLDDFEAEYDRLNQTFIADRNQDMGKEQNYFTMIRQDLDQMPLGDEFASQIAVRNAWRKGYPNKSFSKERIEIADEHQKPIRLGATQIWFEQVSKQEHYIASAILAKDLQYIADNQVLRDGLKQRFGRRANSWLRKYVNDWANPTMYRTFDSVTRWMGVVRNNMAVAYLGFNLLTVLKQAPSLAFYLKGANPVNLLAAASEMVLHPFETIRFVEKMDPQIAARSYDRLTEELKGYDPNKAVRTMRKVGQVSMKPIMWMDKAIVTIGWLAVYKNQIAKGASELEAAREAQKVTLDTQEAGRPKDVAEMYRSNELANWFTMFSNQLNQIWNMYTFDIPNAIKQREAAKLAGILAGIAVSGIAIAYLSGWRAPEDPEDLPKEAAVELFKNFLSAVPFLGNGLESGYDKSYGAGLDPFPIAYAAGKLMADVSGDPEKIGPDIASLVEDLAILTGLPVTGTKRLVNVGRYQHLNELLGYGFAQYTR